METFRDKSAQKTEWENRDLSGPVLTDDFLQEADVLGERLAALSRERASGQWAPILKRLRDREEAGLLKRAKMRVQIAVGHRHGGLEVRERQLIRRREHGENGQTTLLVNRPVELGNRIGLHVVAGDWVIRR